MIELPRLYPILDRGTLDRLGMRLSSVAAEFARSGAELVQYRDKDGTPEEIVRNAQRIGEIFAETSCRLILNDRADLAALAGWRGVHVGHLDMPPCAVRQVLGEMTGRAFIGLSTHNDEQVAEADAGCCDYVAVGPIFSTSTKTDTEPVVGLEGLRRARALTRKPLVAIGGITRANARAVWDAGADSLAVIGGLFVSNERPGKVIADFLEVLR